MYNTANGLTNADAHVRKELIIVQLKIV